MSDRNQGKPDADKKPTTTIEKDGAQQPTDAELDRVEGGMPAVTRGYECSKPSGCNG